MPFSGAAGRAMRGAAKHVTVYVMIASFFSTGMNFSASRIEWVEQVYAADGPTDAEAASFANDYALAAENIIFEVAPSSSNDEQKVKEIEKKKKDYEAKQAAAQARIDKFRAAYPEYTQKLEGAMSAYMMGENPDFKKQYPAFYKANAVTLGAYASLYKGKKKAKDTDNNTHLAEDGQIMQAKSLKFDDDTCIRLSCTDEHGFETVAPDDTCGPTDVPKVRLVKVKELNDQKLQAHKARNAALDQGKAEAKKKYIAQLEEQYKNDPDGLKDAMAKADGDFEDYYRSFYRPENITVMTAFIPERVGISAKTGEPMTNQFAQVNYVIENDSNRIIAFDRFEKTYATDPPTVYQSFWNPSAGYRDSVTGKIMGDIYPGESLGDKQAVFNALLGMNLGSAGQLAACNFAKNHFRAAALEADPSITVADAFFDDGACEKDALPCCTATNGLPLCGKDQELKDSPFLMNMTNVAGTIENDGHAVDLNDPNELKKRLNLRTIHAVRKGQLSNEAIILGSMNADPEFANYQLGPDEMSESCQAEFNDDLKAQRREANEDIAKMSKEDKREFADIYDKQILLDALELKFNDCVQGVGGIANFACYPNCGQKEMDGIGSVPDATGTERELGSGKLDMNRAMIKSRNRVMEFMGEDNVDKIFSTLRTSLDNERDEFGIASEWDFGAFHNGPGYEEYNVEKGIWEKKPYYCNTGEGRYAFRKLYEKLARLPYESATWQSIHDPNSALGKVLKAVKKDALAHIKKKQNGMNKQCQRAAAGFKPTIELDWRPWNLFMARGHDGVDLWRDKNVMRHIIQQMVVHKPPQMQELQAYRRFMCQYEKEIESRDDKMFWIDVVSTAILLATPLSQYLVALKNSAAATRLATMGRFVLAVDTAWSVNRLYAGTVEEKEKIENARILFSGSFATAEDIQKAEKAYGDTVFLSVVMAGAVAYFGANDIATLGRQFRASTKVGRLVSESEATAIAKALKGNGGNVPEHLIKRVFKRGAPCMKVGNCAEELHRAIAKWAKGADKAAEGLPLAADGAKLVAGDAVKITPKGAKKPVVGKISDFAPNGAHAPAGHVFVEDADGVLHLLEKDGAMINKIKASDLKVSATKGTKPSKGGKYSEELKLGETGESFVAPDGYVWYSVKGQKPILVTRDFSDEAAQLAAKIRSKRDAMRAMVDGDPDEIYYVSFKKDGKDVEGFVKINGKGKLANGSDGIVVQFADNVGGVAGSTKKMAIGADEIEFFTAARNLPNKPVAKFAKEALKQASKQRKTRMMYDGYKRQQINLEEAAKFAEKNADELEKQAKLPNAKRETKKAAAQARKDAKRVRAEAHEAARMAKKYEAELAAESKGLDAARALVQTLSKTVDELWKKAEELEAQAGKATGAKKQKLLAEAKATRKELETTRAKLNKATARLKELEDIDTLARSGVKLDESEAVITMGKGSDAGGTKVAGDQPVPPRKYAEPPNMDAPTGTPSGDLGKMDAKDVGKLQKGDYVKVDAAGVGNVSRYGMKGDEVLSGQVTNIKRKNGMVSEIEVRLSNGRTIKLYGKNAEGVLRKPTLEGMATEIENTLGIKLTRKQIKDNPDMVDRLYQSAQVRKRIESANVEPKLKNAWREKHQKAVEKHYKGCL